MSGFDFDFKSSKTTHSFLRRGQGKRISNRFSDIQRDYLRKGDGKLASNYHGETNFAMKRQQKVVDEQFEREELHRKNNKK
tara:strand:- start:813 stop:1055 length:243 start_codon:yes stop_codon:yes gene_type:complete